MPTYKKRIDFSTSSEGIMAAQTLQSMVLDEAYMTAPSFSANTAKFANNLIPFIEKHMQYLNDHPATDAQHYLSNLKLITKIR